MRYLLLSVLVVCVIGVMVPSVFAYHNKECCFGGFDSIGEGKFLQHIPKYGDHDYTYTAQIPYNPSDPRAEEKIKISGTIDGVGYAADSLVHITIKEPDGKTYKVTSKPTHVLGTFGNNYSATFVNYVTICCNNFGTYVVTAEFGEQVFHPELGWNMHVEYWSSMKINVVAPTPIPESVAEPKTVTYATLPPGVKSPAPNFESEISTKYTHFDTKYGLTIGELYANWDYEWDSGFIKIVSGDGKDLLVWMLPISCDFQSSECSESVTFHIGDFYMYDGKDRKFEPVTSSTLNWTGSTVENTNFSWREDCSPLPVTVQPGIMDKMKICFEIPKNSDHFKLLDFYNLDGDVVLALLDRSTISNTASKQSQSGGGCLIATAAFGSEMAPQVQFLRELRDNTVLQTESGASFMVGFNQFYYSFSPTVADYERENPAFKEAVKITLTPLLSSLTLLQYADIDSESEMLGYGIGVILLNIGMYFVAPAVLIMAVRKRV